MKLSGLIMALGFLILVQACKTEVAQWRGPQRNGIFPETNLMDQWPGEGPELRWVFEGIGRGYAAPAVSGDMLFVNGELEGESMVFALDLEGNLKWTSPNGKEFLGEGFSSTYPGARSTPTLFGKHLYTSSGQGRITCLEASTGKEVWALDLINNLGGELGYFGYSESLAVDEDYVYCFPAGPETNFAALNRFTGEPVWTSEVLRDTFAYGSPLLVDLPARNILINTSRHHLFTLDRSNGDLLASYPIEGYEYDGEHCNTPVYDRGNIYFVGNDVEGQGAFKVALSEDGEKITEVWRNQEIKNNFGGLVVVDEHLFTMMKGNRLLSLDPETGAISDSLKADTGSLVFADNKFFCYGNNGTINLVTYNEGELKIAGTFKVREGSGHHFSHPVLSGGIMYIRHGDALMAYKIGN
jgi:outer membrane protein assembly factor BamB